MINNCNRVGVLLRFIREKSKPPLYRDSVVSGTRFSKFQLTDYEFGWGKLPEDLIELFSQRCGISSKYLLTLNDSIHHSEKEQSEALFKIFTFVRGKQSSATDINRILVLMRLVSGYTIPREFAKKLTNEHDETYGSLETIDHHALRKIENSTPPTQNQLRLYSTFFNVDLKMLTFWLNSSSNLFTNEQQANLYKLFLASINVYNTKYCQSRH